MFRKIGLISNPDKAEAVRMAGVAASFFSDNHIETVYLQDEKDDLHSVDLILTFGGDGTFLIGARMAMMHEIPLMGINLGTVGVTRGGFARLIQVECSVNREVFGTFTADGMIAATPTGSTGYSLSAGGPIVQPDMDCIILTPVCAHSLQTCPCVVSETSEISFRLNPERKQTAELQIDGMDCAKLEAGDEIIITGSNRKMRLLRIHPYHFFSLVRSKLIEWSLKY